MHFNTDGQWHQMCCYGSYRPRVKSTSNSTSDLRLIHPFCEFLKRESRTDWIREMKAAWTNFISAVHRAQFLEICARPESFWSTPRIATSGKVQFRKSMIHGLPVNLSMLRVKYYKSDWLKRLLCAFSENWTFPEVAILGVDQKERGLWGGECALTA